MSPRIFFYDLRRAFGQLFRLLGAASVIAALGWGGWLGVRKGLLENPEFRLTKVEINANTAVDGARLFEVAGIGRGDSLFDCDASEIEGRLAALPEVTGARVTREFPGTLKVEVTPRQPALWVACPSQGVGARDVESGLLVDSAGRTFRCTTALFGGARDLPVIEVRESEEPLAAGRGIRKHPDFMRGLRLLEAAESRLPGAGGWIDTVRQRNAWSSLVVTHDGIEAVFGHDDLERQVDDLLAAVEHARSKGDRIARITLIGKRNLPVEFHEPVIPRAIPVEEIETRPQPEENSDLRNLLDR